MDDNVCSCPYDFQTMYDCLDACWNDEEGCYDPLQICFGCPFAGQLTEFFS